MPNKPLQYLKNLSDICDEDIDLAEASLMLAMVDQPDISLERYQNHLKKLVKSLIQTHSDMVKDVQGDGLDLRLEAIRSVFSGEGYQGDEETYEDLQNASLIRTIERRKGLPITLAILCVHMMRGASWDGYGLNVPGHFVCRLDMDGGRIIFDPFDDCKKLEAHDLRALIKRVHGEGAELSSDFYAPALNRETLIRLQNNIKYRQIEAEDYEGALQVVETMRLIDHEEYRLLLDAGVLYARVGQSRAAIDVLEEYIKLAPNDRDRYEATMLLRDLRTSLN
ncbi:transglutaminase-like domain-containing protein [Alphaproteobacteria bacterium]|nr:transglutaminase-like domain-containing protein [Alphaproteobacteria bacterium]